MIFLTADCADCSDFQQTTDFTDLYRLNFGCASASNWHRWAGAKRHSREGGNLIIYSAFTLSRLGGTWFLEPLMPLTCALIVT